MKYKDTNPRPRDPATNAELPPTYHPGYYPGYSTMNQRTFWDAATRATVENRVEHPPAIRFFDKEQAEVMHCVLEHVLPQSDRDPEWQVPLLNHLDDRLYENKISGFRYEDMPPDQDAYRLAIRAFQQMARDAYGKSFTECSYTEREALLKSLHDGEPAGARNLWSQMSLKRFWGMLLHDAADAYYAHPWAWDEIGFGGPAYPRGYMRLDHGEPEPWEVDEQRYEWIAPAGCLSDKKS